MTSNQKPRNDSREVLFNRREYLRTAGLLTGSAGLGAVGGTVRATATGATAEFSSVTADGRWRTVGLAESYDDPVVISPTLTFRGPQSATPRVRNVTPSSFELSVREWNYRDGSHRAETVGYFASDPATYGLADGTTVEVGRVETNHRWTSVSLSASFASTPVVFSQAQTVAGAHPVVTRHRGVSGSGFEVRLQESESKGVHRTETVGYLAVEPGIGTLNGRSFEASASSVGGSWRTVGFGGRFRSPTFVADSQTFRGPNPCVVRYRNLTDSSVELSVREERSTDPEIAHRAEQVGYLVVEGTNASDRETPLSELDRSWVEKLTHKYVNVRRAERGRQALNFDTDLREIARYHSRDMAERSYCAHVSPSGETIEDRYAKFDYDCRAETGNGRYYTHGENVFCVDYNVPIDTAGGTVTYSNADELARGIVKWWMNSEGHRENLLKRAWDNEGIGVAVTDEGRVYVTQNFC